MRLAIVLVCAASVARADAICPKASDKVAAAFADGATTDELTKFAAAFAPRYAKHCAATDGWTKDALACFDKASIATAPACLDKLPAPLRDALAADAAATFPYAVAMAGGQLVIHGPVSLAEPSRALDAVAAFIAANAFVRVDVLGYADDVGGPARRRAQATARAEAARAYLVKMGAEAVRVTATGKGVEKPPARDRFVRFVATGHVTALPPVATTPVSGAEKARQLYTDGVRAYGAGDYDLALAKFQQAYAEAPEPAVMFNIGQSYKQKGDKANAIRSFEAYLQARPGAPNAASVQQMIDALRNTP